MKLSGKMLIQTEERWAAGTPDPLIRHQMVRAKRLF
jgi:hypothetical protein